MRQTGEVVTQEFHISVTPVEMNKYYVRMEQAAPGVPMADEVLTWPVAEWLNTAAHLINDPLQSVLQGDGIPGLGGAIALNSINLVALGQQLHNALFQGTLRDSWITAQGIAQNQHQLLHMRLGLSEKDTRLAQLPWEVMHIGDRPLATGHHIAFSRYQSGVTPTSKLSGQNIANINEAGGVKVLMVISSPLDHVRLDLLKQEVINLQAEIRKPPSRFQADSKPCLEIEMTLLDQPGREELTQALEQGHFHILHYSGHSNTGANGGEIYLVSKKTGLTETLSGDDLAGLLVNNNILMAVFNSCLGAYTAKSPKNGVKGERNLTESLVKRGLKSVLAMSERIPDEVALTLTKLFYRNLSQGYPLDLCVSRVRQGLISAYGSHQMYWALPVLYTQRDFDGFSIGENNSSNSEDLLNEYESPLETMDYIPTSPINDPLQLPLDFDRLTSDSAESVVGASYWSGDDTWNDFDDDFVNDLDHPSYEDNAAVVADLFHHLGDFTFIGETSGINGEIWQPAPENNGSDNATNYSFNHQFSHQSNPDIEEKPGFWTDMPTEISPPFSSDVPSNWTHTPQFVLPTEKPRRLQPLGILGMLGLLVISVIIALNLWRTHKSATSIVTIPQMSTQDLASSLPTTEFKKPQMQIPSSTATTKLRQSDLQAEVQAIEELCDRHDWKAAEDALAHIPEPHTADPQVDFLRGRLVWQMYQAGDKKFKVDLALKFWAVAVQNQPDSVIYNNALGFAYYEIDDLNHANDSWFKALNLAQKLENSPLQPQDSDAISTSLDALNAYAGLALALYKSADWQPQDKRAQYINEAVRLHQIVTSHNPLNFTAKRLAHNWLWTPHAIADWESLSQQKSK